jgi:integrase
VVLGSRNTRYLNRWILPCWATEMAASMEPIDVQNWLRQLGKDCGLSNQTRAKIRQTMSLVYTHGMRYGLLPRGDGANPVTYVRQSCVSDYEPVVLTPSQCKAILSELKNIHRVLVLTAAATALRISEVLALRWMNVDYDNQCIYVRRAWVYGKFGPPKSEASKNRRRGILFWPLC